MKSPVLVRLISCCALLLLTGSVRAQLEGKLFTQPEEREYLDSLRAQFLRDNAEDGFNIEVVEIPELPADETAVAEAGPVEINFGGIMTRRDGSHSIWVNGRSLSEQELPSGMSLVTGERSVSLRISEDGNIYVLRPGQSVNLSTGTIIENFQRPQPEPPEDTQAVPAETTALDVTTQAAEDTAEAQASPGPSEASDEDPVDASDADPASTLEAESAATPTEAERTEVVAEALSQMSAEDVEQLVETLRRIREEENADDEP